MPGWNLVLTRAEAALPLHSSRSAAEAAPVSNPTPPPRLNLTVVVFVSVVRTQISYRTQRASIVGVADFDAAVHVA
jgi:hypothetical protein